MPKLNGIVYGPQHELIGYTFMCPGCRQVHAPSIKKYGEGKNPVWTFNGDVNKPTFSPSLLVKYTWGPEKIEFVCHSFIKDGKIQFLSDCTHAFKSMTVEIPEWLGFDDEIYPPEIFSPSPQKSA